MKILSEKMINTKEFAGCVDIITGIDDFETELEFDPEWHVYRLNGKILPSVTQILDDGKYDNIDKDILKYAQEKGTIVHAEIERYLKTQEMGFTGEFYTFLDIFIENKVLFENKAIFDIKTYSVATPQNREKCYKQEKMYAEGIKYLTGEDIKNFYMIHLPHNKKGKIIDLGKEFENEIND